MTKKIELKAQIRSAQNGQTKKLREKDFIPAVVYGAGIKNSNIKIKKNDFARVFEKAGEATLINLMIDKDAPLNVIIKDVQKDPIKNNIIHADFYKVDMNKKIDVQIPIHFINEAPAVKELGGTLVINIETLDASCLPADLVDHVDVDLSKLKTHEDYIRIEDIILPQRIEVYQKKDEVVANVKEVEKEIVEEAPKEATVETPAGATEEKKDAQPLKEGEEKKS